MPTTFTVRTPVTTTFTCRTPITTNWDKLVDFLLQESSSFLLLENGFRIVLSGITSESIDWTKRTAI